MTYKEILGVVPTLQAAALVEDNFHLAARKKKKAGDFLGAATRTVVGTSLIGAEARIIGGL